MVGWGRREHTTMTRGVSRSRPDAAVSASAVVVVAIAVVVGSLAGTEAVELGQSGYHALIMENTRSVTVMPPLAVAAGQACSFELGWERAAGRDDDPPFAVDDRLPQEPRIVPTREPNCELQRYYRLQLLAYDCEPGKPVGNATVHITVEDENEFEPEFSEGAYQATARENHMHISPPILQVTARDKDCTPKKSDICKYEIVSSDVAGSSSAAAASDRDTSEGDRPAELPFQIDAEGNIRNTRPLAYEESHNYIFEVVAYDCSMKPSKPVSVSISVQKECHMQWTSIAQQIDYTAGSGAVALYGNAQLDTCPSDCEVDEIYAKIQLDTKHIGKGCDRDTYSVRSQRKLCNAALSGNNSNNQDGGTLSTLLGADQASPTVGKSGSSRAPSHDRGNENSAIYFFDGKTNALLLPRDTFHQTDTMAVQFWMKHEQNNDKKAKEHVLCTSDSHKMNRHHFSVFLHNCHLVLLVRKHNANYHKLFPAEFRWRVSEVCDFEWHHYTINLAANGGDHQATLFIDGRPAEQSADIVDDWPIHRNIHVGNETTTVVGACWQAKQSHMAMHFKGYLSDLVVLNNATEPESVLKCMYHCKESLVRATVPGTAAAAGPSGASLTSTGGFGGDAASGGSEETLSDVEALSADSVESIERQISRLAYRNSRRQPTPGNRLVQLNTHVKCTNGQSKRLPMVETIIAVKNVDVAAQYGADSSGSGEQATRIVISSEEHNIAREYGPIKEGVDIFETINIKTQQPGENIDSCTIEVFPALNPDHETLRVPEYALDKMGITSDDSSSSMSIGQGGASGHPENQQIRLRGPAPAENFQKVISNFSYLNKKPAYYLNRAFKLQCYEMANRFSSNEYIQTLTVIHPSAVISASSSGNHITGNHLNQPVAAKLMQDKQSAHGGSPVVNGPQKHHLGTHARTASIPKRSSSSSIGIAGLVVGGLVATVLALLVVVRRQRRGRASASASSPNGGQLSWDDSALTITVNPLSSEDWDPGRHVSASNLVAAGCHGDMAHASLADMMAIDDSSGESSCGESDDSDDEAAPAAAPSAGAASSAGSLKHLAN